MSLDELFTDIDNMEFEEKDIEIIAETFMKEFNRLYRLGTPIISDLEYDYMLRRYAEAFPNNSYFNQLEVEVEPELVGGKTVKLPKKMLSTNKAYSNKDIAKFLDDCVEVGRRLGVKNIVFRITPKLDGYAGYREDSKLFTRGNGTEGGDISHALVNGLQSPQFEWAIDSNGPGEIVCDKAYFAEHLADSYENTRNIIAGAIKGGELDPKIKEAIRLGKIVFYPFNNLGGWLLPKEKVLEELEVIWDSVVANCLYSTDGLVLECNNEKIKTEMGCTSHHHRWQIALKRNEEFHEVKVLDVIWQTGRTGKITPVAIVEPTLILGAVVKKVSVHNAGMIIKLGAGKNAIVRMTRSGAVIPYIESVIKKGEVELPKFCGSCGGELTLEGDFLMCNSVYCGAQVAQTIEHWFKTIQADGFGPAIIDNLCNWGYDNIVDIYQMHQQDFYNVFGNGKTAENLYNEVQATMKRELTDYRFLSAFALTGLGECTIEKLLKVYPLEDIFDLTQEDIMKVEGYGSINSSNLVESLHRIKDDFECLLDMGFNLTKTIIGGIKMDNQISGKSFCITGTLLTAKRETLHEEIKSLGGIVATSVSAKTNYLVAGLSCGAAKSAAALKHGVKVISEDEFLEMLK